MPVVTEVSHVQAAGVNLIRFEVHFNVEGTGFDGMRPDGISSKVTSTVARVAGCAAGW